jgi:isopentenyl diphosphate isomerase/L-lactate dehydrogenase-like FMN-dependent dehydrogenase
MSGPAFLNLHEVEALAREHLPPATWDYFAGGAEDEITLHANRKAFEQLELRYRVLVDVSRRDASLELFGTRIPAPIVVAPMAFQRLAHPEGECAMARGAAAAGLPMTVSTFSTVALEEVCAVGPGPRWFQLYVHRDRGITRELVRRAHAAGYQALVLTVDVPEIGRRERDIRNQFRLAGELRAANFVVGESDALLGADGSALAAFVGGVREPSLTWNDLEWLRGIAPMPLLVKGIVRADDARRAVACGAAGVVVSNHGGRQLDGAIASLRALPEVAEAVAADVVVMVDGGIRRGTDIVKALALGARAVMVGRPILWALSICGEAGVRHALEILKAELDGAMALTGAPTLQSLTRDLLP